MTALTFTSLLQSGKVSSAWTADPTAIEHGMYASRPAWLRLLARPKASLAFPSGRTNDTLSRTSILWRVQRRDSDPGSSVDIRSGDPSFHFGNHRFPHINLELELVLQRRLRGSRKCQVDLHLLHQGLHSRQVVAQRSRVFFTHLHASYCGRAQCLWLY